MTEVFGGDPWPDDVEPNRKTLAAILTFMREKTVTPRPVPIEAMFVKTRASN